MKAEEDIEKQLAATQNAWDSQPSAELWGRLEERLEEAQPTMGPRKPKNWPFRIVSVLLVIGIGTGIWLAWPDEKQEIPMAKPIAAHQIVDPGTELHAEQRDTVAKANSHLTFGENVGIGESVLGRAKSTTLGGRTGGLFADFRSQRLGLQGATKMHFGSGAVENENPGAQASYNGSSVQINGGFPVNNPGTANMYAGKPELEVTANLLPLGNMLVTNSVGNPIDTVNSLQQYSNLIQSNDNNRYLQINAARNDMNFNFAGPSTAGNQENLQHLKWLLGSWKTQGASGGAIEEWRQLDDFTLVGRGYFVVNGDTIVTQEMRIEQRGPNVYYIIVKDENAKAMKFRLRSRMSNELIFQDESPKTDQELVLRNNPAKDEVEKIISTPAERSVNQLNKSSQNSPGNYKVMQRKKQP